MRETDDLLLVLSFEDCKYFTGASHFVWSYQNPQILVLSENLTSIFKKTRSLEDFQDFTRDWDPNDFREAAQEISAKLSIDEIKLIKKIARQEKKRQRRLLVWNSLTLAQKKKLMLTHSPTSNSSTESPSKS